MAEGGGGIVRTWASSYREGRICSTDLGMKEAGGHDGP